MMLGSPAGTLLSQANAKLLAPVDRNGRSYADTASAVSRAIGRAAEALDDAYVGACCVHLTGRVSRAAVYGKTAADEWGALQRLLSMAVAVRSGGLRGNYAAVSCGLRVDLAREEADSEFA